MKILKKFQKITHNNDRKHKSSIRYDGNEFTELFWRIEVYRNIINTDNNDSWTLCLTLERMFDQKIRENLEV